MSILHVLRLVVYRCEYCMLGLVVYRCEYFTLGLVVYTVVSILC